jgi:alpha,alpha-trehalase
MPEAPGTRAERLQREAREVHAPERRPLGYEAVIFDLDGVVTDTATIHSAAWKALFDDYLRPRSGRRGEPFRPFSIEEDYPTHVDGRPRYDGVRAFLVSRGVDLPFGDPEDPAGGETVCGLGNRKDALFAEVLRREGVRVFKGTVRLIRELTDAGVRLAVVSSSRNTRLVLQRAGIEDLFPVRVDGVVAADLGLPGKPAPDTFWKAAELLQASPSATIVVEDALSGVEAGRAGGFLLVIGVDRRGQADALSAAGADLVVADLATVSPDDLDRWCRAKRQDREGPPREGPPAGTAR